jgi:hypothetical protein
MATVSMAVPGLLPMRRRAYRNPESCVTPISACRKAAIARQHSVVTRLKHAAELINPGAQMDLCPGREAPLFDPESRSLPGGDSVPDSSRLGIDSTGRAACLTPVLPSGWGRCPRAPRPATPTSSGRSTSGQTGWRSRPITRVECRAPGGRPRGILKARPRCLQDSETGVVLRAR